jgi:hypothetical protein
MPAVTQQNKTRKEYRIKDIPLPEDDIADCIKETQQRLIDEENERIWAHYHDPETNLTQLEARDRAQKKRYPPAYQVSQSTVSRIINTLDDEMLTQPLLTIDMEEPDFDDERSGLLHPDMKRVLEEKRCESVCNAWRSTIAAMICDMHALRAFTYDEETPAWAHDRFPSVQSGVGDRIHDEHGDFDL